MKYYIYTLPFPPDTKYYSLHRPPDMFSVITVSGQDRGSVILITAYDDSPAIVFKHMSGLQKNSEFRLAQFTKVWMIFVSNDL